MSPQWWKTAVIYQIYPRSFMDANGDGIGDLPGITAKLDYLAHTLGVDAIWLSPFFTSPMADFGYDVANYVDVDPIFGNLDDFDALLGRAHQLGLKVIIDWVPNHSSSDHPWFVESRSSLDNPKRDWYSWRDPAPDGSEPNNWVSVFGGPAWTYDEATDQYYLHSFLSQQPDINWRNSEAKAAMLDTLRFWLDRGVDGFRMDVCHFLMKDPRFRSNPVLEKRQAGYKDLGEYDRLIHLHDRGHPDIHPLFRDIRMILDGYSQDQPRFSVGEIHLTDWDEWAAYYGDDDELHMPYNFALVAGEWTGAWARNVVDSLEAAIPDNAWPNYVLGNHDEPRIASRLGAQRARLAVLLLLTLRGTPTLYYGDELGMLQADIPPEEQQDPWGRRRPGLGRDGCRTPMQWLPEEGAGFSTAKSWLAPNDPDHLLNVAAQLGDPTSTLSFYRRLLTARRASEALRHGSYEPIEGVPTDCFAYCRSAEGESVAVYLNFGDHQLTVRVEGELIMATRADHPGPVAGIVHLGPLEGVAVRTAGSARQSGIDRR